MSSFLENISLDNESFRSYAFWTAVLILKTLAMAGLTSALRHIKKAFVNPEDMEFKNINYSSSDPEVERVRRAHRNDLENILPFITIGFLYLLTSPTTYVAVNIFRAVGIARIVHTIVYTIIVLPQPTRGIAWFVGFAATSYMAVQTIFYVL